MKFRLISYIILFLLSTLIFASTKIALVLRAKGAVTVESAEKKNKTAGKTGMGLADGDKLITGDNSFAAIRFFDDKSLVKLRSNSICSIEGKKKDKKIEKSIWVEVGTFFMDIFKQKGSFKVITPTSVASIKGTKFWAIHSPVTGTKYIGIEGLVEIKNDKGKALMKAGETAIVTSKNDPPLIRLTQKGDLPADAVDEQGEFLEIEFKNNDGQHQKLKIELEKIEK